VMLVALQLEQEAEQPRHLPPAATKPFWHWVHVVEFEHVMQFLGQPPQEPPPRVFPGGHERQFVAEV